jgi:drug/metabolite transporter (DMT)-like permease
MTRPNLKDPAELKAYKTELRRLYRGWRWLGFVIIAAGVAIALFGGNGFDLPSLILLGIGWAILLVVIVARTRYHQRRMREV